MVRDSEDRRIAEAWQLSSQKHAVARREDLAQRWLLYHWQMLANHEHTHRLLMAHHRGEILRYMRILGIEEVA